MAANVDEQQWITQAELTETAAYILRNGSTRVALQFPDELLAMSPAVAAALSEECNSSASRPLPVQPTDSASISPLDASLAGKSTMKNDDGAKSVRVFVLADTTYGSCCVDEVAAAHVDAQCVVHFGRACLSSTSRLPARFVFGMAPLNINDCTSKLLEVAKAKKKPLLVLFGLEYAHAMPHLRSKLEASESVDIRFADMPTAEMDPASVPNIEGVAAKVQMSSREVLDAPRSSVVNSRPDGGNCGEERREEPSKEPGLEGSVFSSWGATGQAGCDQLLEPVEGQLLTHGKVEEERTRSSINGSVAEERIHSATSAESSGRGREFRAGGLSWRLKEDEMMTDFVIVWAGKEGPALTDVMLTHNQCELVRYDPAERRVIPDVPDNSKFLKRRYYLVERAKNASIVGIVVGTLSSAGYLTVIKRLRAVIAAAGKKSYTFVMGKPNPAKLANFPECEVFVLVACPQTALLDSKEYLSPVITPFEAELAFVEKQAWTGEYKLDFSGVTESVEVDEKEEGQSDEDEPRFSLISGGYESSALSRGVEDPVSSSALIAVSNSVKTIQLAGGHGALALAGQRKQQSAAKSGAEFLVSKRSYQGLSVPQYLQTEDGVQCADLEGCTPVRPAVKGRSGRAAGYVEEH